MELGRIRGLRAGFWAVMLDTLAAGLARMLMAGAMVSAGATLAVGPALVMPATALAQDEEAAARDAADIDSSAFQVADTASEVLASRTLPELISYSTTLSSDTRNLDREMQDLVYNNYNKFISATDTIRRMRDSVGDMESGMQRLVTDMRAMGGSETPVRVLRDYVASAIDMVIHLSRLPDGRRVVSEVVEVGEARETGVEVRLLHRHRIEQVREGRVDGVFEATGTTPTFLDFLGSQGHRIDHAAFAAGPLAAGPSR